MSFLLLTEGQTFINIHHNKYIHAIEEELNNYHLTRVWCIASSHGLKDVFNLFLLFLESLFLDYTRLHPYAREPCFQGNLRERPGPSRSIKHLIDFSWNLVCCIFRNFLENAIVSNVSQIFTIFLQRTTAHYLAICLRGASHSSKSLQYNL